jgi:hypothetical protein
MLELEIASRSADEWSVPISATRVQEWRDRDGRICAIGYAEEGRGWLEWSGLATFAFADGSTEVLAISHAPHLSTHQPLQSTDAQLRDDKQRLAIEDIFHRSATPIILQAFGREALHASAVLIDQRVVGFCGLSESGKSTLAYAIARLGYPHLADDALLLDFAETGEPGGPLVKLLPFSPRLRPASQLFFGIGQQSLVENASDLIRTAPPRVTPSLSPTGPTATSAQGTRERLSGRLGMLFVLDRNGAPTPRITQMPEADAFTHVLTHAYCFNPVDERSKRRIVANYLSLVSQVRVYRLEFTGELRHLGGMANAVLEAVGGRSLVRARE